MNVVRQPDLSTICGQCCLSMLCDTPLSKIINLVGHSHSTNTKELVKVIRRLGFDCGDRLVATKNMDRALRGVERALVKIKFDHRSSWHWVAWADELVFDPSNQNPLNGFRLFSLMGGRPSSFLEIKSGTRWAPMQMVLLEPPTFPLTRRDR